MRVHDLTNKVVLLTGIGAVGEGWGNGTTIATLFARQGATIFGCDINPTAAEKAANTIRNDPEVRDSRKGEKEKPLVEVMAESIDVTSASACKALFDACIAKHNRVDILVNNVGRSEPGGPAELSEQTWDEQININLKSVYLMCHLVLPVMEQLETGGCILNVASIAGLRYVGKPQVAYASTKAAIIQFTKTTAVIYAQRTGGKVRLNTVVPGLIATPLVSVLAKKYGATGGDEQRYKRMRDRQVPMGKMGSAWDVAHAALFLCSDEAAYITGQEIIVDGGIVNSTGLTVEDLAKL